MAVAAPAANGSVVLTDWIAEHRDELGREYANELDRQFRTGRRLRSN